MSGGFGNMGAMTFDAKTYVETIALELSRVRGAGLVLSPADAQLALAWHAAGVPLAEVAAQVRRLARLRGPGQARGAVAPNLSLQLLARHFAARPKPPRKTEPDGLSAELRAAAQRPGLAAAALWRALADEAEELLAAGAERYWTQAVRALQAALRELPRTAGLEAGAALRARIAPRPPSMPRKAYRRSLQLMLLTAASERLGLPPRAFLL